MTTGGDSVNRRAERRIAWAASAVLGAAALASLALLHREWLVRDAQMSAATAIDTLDRGAPRRFLSPTLDLSLPARALLPAAMLRARIAVSARQGPAQRAQLDQALVAIDAALVRRPRWGEAHVARAFILSHLDGPGSPRALAAFSRGYLDAPYLRQAARWRLGFGLSQWSALTPAVQQRWVNEAIWHVRLEPDDLSPLFAAVRGTGAYLPLMLGWRDVRSRDMDVVRAR